MRSNKLYFAPLAALVFAVAAVAADEEQASTITFGGGKFQLKAPDTWARKKPLSRIVEYEFGIPAAKDDPADGYLTTMGATGGVEANLQRWYGQFTQPDGGNTSDRAKIKHIKIADMDVHLVDISGTMRDMRQPGVALEKYRMLAAVIVGNANSAYFVKMVGPERTVAENEKAFLTMIEGLQRK